MLDAGLAQSVQDALAFGLAVLIVVAVAIYLKRGPASERLSRRGVGMGLRYQKQDPWDLPARYRALNLFTYGSEPKVENVFEGTLDGSPVVAFDYSLRITEKGARLGYEVAAFEMPISAPRLLMTHQRLRDEFAHLVYREEIEFESGEFTRRYHVVCDERKFAYDIFHPRLLETILACEAVPVIEMNGPYLLLYYGPRNPETPGDPERIRQLLTLGRQIIRSIPDYVRTERPAGT